MPYDSPKNGPRRCTGIKAPRAVAAESGKGRDAASATTQQLDADYKRN